MTYERTLDQAMEMHLAPNLRARIYRLALTRAEREATR